MRITRDEFAGYMQNWDEQTRRLLVERMEQGFRREQLEHFTHDEAATLQAILDRLIPQLDGEAIDLVGFVDWAVDKPLGRGDRQEGLPSDEALFRSGVAGVDETAQQMFQHPFTQLQGAEQDVVLRAVQESTVSGGVWHTIPSDQFFVRLLQKALTGYCAHPDAWMRMGFPGPSYPEGYTWIDSKEILARRRHVPGWKTL